jgi:hypothetical protein
MWASGRHASNEQSGSEAKGTETTADVKLQRDDPKAVEPRKYSQMIVDAAK